MTIERFQQALFLAEVIKKIDESIADWKEALKTTHKHSYRIKEAQRMLQQKRTKRKEYIEMMIEILTIPENKDYRWLIKSNEDIH